MRRASAIGACVSATLAVAYVLPAASGANAAQTDLPISGVVANPCNNEVVTFSGAFHGVMNAVSDGSGGFNLSSHINVHVTGTGDQGNGYVGDETVNISSHFQAGQVNTQANEFELISKGSAPNFKLDVLSHLTVNPDGTVTASVDNFRQTCS